MCNLFRQHGSRSGPLRSSNDTAGRRFSNLARCRIPWSHPDAVFDTVGGDVAQRSFTVLKPGGRAAFIASGAQVPEPDRSDVVALRPSVGRDRQHLERIVALVAIGAVRPPEVTLYKLSEAAAAHEVSESLHFRGKLVFSSPLNSVKPRDRRRSSCHKLGAQRLYPPRP